MTRLIVEIPDDPSFSSIQNDLDISRLKKVRSIIIEHYPKRIYDNVQVMIDDRPEPMDFVKEIRPCFVKTGCTVLVLNTTPVINLHSDSPEEVNPYRLPNLREGR